jgi:DNA-binding transcriptional LysR family regulator
MREADLALRTVRPDKGDLVVQQLASVKLGVMRSPSLAVKKGAKLRDLPWLAYDRSLDHIPESRWLAAHVPDARVVMRSTELGTLVAAAKAGVGVVLMAEAVGERAGGLVPVPIPIPPSPEGALWLVAHAALRPVARVAAVWDWLVESFRPGRPARR